MIAKNLRSKSSKNKIFRGFRVFEYALWQKANTRKCRKSTESFLNQKNTQCQPFTITRKLLKSNHFVIQVQFDFNNKKAAFKLKW